MHIKSIAALTLATTMLLFSSSAYASDGTISFAGSVSDATCTIKINNGGTSGTVNLPAVSKTVLAASGAVAGATNFSLSLTGCTTGKAVNAFFEAGPTIDLVTGNLINSGSAANVEVQVLSSTGAAIALGNATQATSTSINTTTTPSVTGGALNYIAQYYATGVSTSGTVTSSVTYSLTYN